MKKKVIFLLVVICILGLAVFYIKQRQNDKDQEQNNDNLEYVEEETVEMMVSRFNTQIFDNSGLGPVSNYYLKIDDGKYWYELTDGIYLVVSPIGKQKSKEEDIVDFMKIYVEKEYKDDPQVLAYTRLLIMANNNDITYNEAQTLIDKALELSSKNNSNKGILVSYLETDDYFEYKIIRNYK